MSVQNKRARRRPLALLAAACAATATAWAIGGQAHILAATMPEHSLGSHLQPRAARAAHRPRRGRARHRHHRRRVTHATRHPRGLSSGSFTNGAGTLQYELYVPSSYHAGNPMPLVVAMHGCTETADSYRQLSGWGAYAQANGFIVLFPQQSPSRNFLRCWNWFVAPDMQRGSGEPAIIAGMVSSTEQRYSINSHRVYVAGFSAGAAMANVMGATYPDMFAAVGSGSGCEYNGLPCVGYPGPDPAQTGQQAYQAMGRHARVMPAIVFQGDSDTVVAPANAPEIVREWQVTDNYVLSGGPNGPLSPFPSQSSFAMSQGGQFYTVTNYPDQHGNQLIQYDLVHGMPHAWSGGNRSQQYSDPSGPNETATMYAFFTTHRLP